MGGTAEEVGRQADQSDWIDTAVRFGLLVYGLVYLLIAWVAVQLALGDYHGAVTKGAFRTLAEQPFGAVLLVVVAVGMLLLVLWRLLDAAVGHREKDGLDRWRLRGYDLAKAVLYGGIGYKAVKTGLGDTSGNSSRTATARLMDLPLGVWIVGAVGIGVAIYGASQAWRGLSEKHREHLAAEGRTGTDGSAYLLLGKIGYVAKGTAFVLVGSLFVYAAVDHRPKRSGGLDAALFKLLEQPYGKWLLLAMAAGLACYGLFQLARARHLSR
jgi:hypothetical protein